MAYPPALQEIIDLCEGLPEPERREALWSYAEAAAAHEPQAEERYQVIDERKDPECLDQVGIYLAVDEEGMATYRIHLGPKVQTLTRALATILCKGFNGAPLGAILDTDVTFVSQIVGEQLMRLRSRTVYYLVQRMRSAATQCAQP